MPSTLSDFCRITMGQSPKGEECNSSGVGVPILNGPTEFQLIYPLPVQWTTNPKKLSKSGDLLFCVRGSTTGRMNWSDQEYAIGRGLASISPIHENTMHFFRGAMEAYLPSLLAGATGSTFPNVNRGDLESIPIPHPDLSYIKNASSILKALERKIELNQKMNHTLEEIAKAIFKSWFVDFDPVRAKLEGRPTGLPPEISDLFPNELVDSELGKIPKGWQVKQIRDLCEVIDCLHSKKPELIQSGFNYIQLNEIGNDGLLHTQSIGKISEIDYKKWTSRIEVCEGDCIITNVGRVGAFARIPYGFKGAIGRNITAMRPLLKDATGSYIATYFLSPLFTKEKESNTDSGTILDALNVKNIPKLRIVTPSNPLLESANHFFNLIWKKRDLLNEENKILSQLRDTLLPKLISGELQIPDAEKFLEEAGI